MGLLTAEEARTEANIDSSTKEEEIRKFWETRVDPKIRSRAKQKKLVCTVRSDFTLEELQGFVANQNLGFILSELDTKKEEKEEKEKEKQEKKKFPIQPDNPKNFKSESESESDPVEETIILISWAS
jgi:hypothetical protein